MMNIVDQLVEEQKGRNNSGKTVYEEVPEGKIISGLGNLILSKSGAIVGEFNHSRKFPAAFRQAVAKVVHSKVKHFPKLPTSKQVTFLH